MKRLLALKLHYQILIALLLALAFGLAVPFLGLAGGAFENGLLAFSDFVGRIFMNALRALMVPLIVTTVICGIMTLGSEKDFSRLGLKTLAYYTVSGALAVLTGLLLVNLIGPGRVPLATAQAIIGQGQAAEQVLSQMGERGPTDLVDIFVRMVPPNIIQAATDNGQLLGLIVAALVVGLFISRLADPHRQTQERFWESAQALMMKITDFVIRFAPLGVFGLVTPVLLRTGFDLFRPLLWFFVTVLLALAFHFVITLGLLLRFVGRLHPPLHYRAMMPALLTAFSTASSSGTLPVTLEAAQDAGISRRTSSFTLPLGATVNMDGTALYECVVVAFIAQLYGVVAGTSLGFAQQLSIALLALLTSIGVAGIPSASIVAIGVILGALGLPLEAVGIVWATDRILDMCRTAVNVFSDTVGAAIIARSEGEKGLYTSVERPT